MKYAPIILAAGLLAACESEPTGVEEGAASGEVLPGSVSDDMIALDQLRSEAELAPRPTATAAATVEASEEETDEPAETTESEAPAPVIVEEPVVQQLPKAKAPAQPEE